MQSYPFTSKKVGYDEDGMPLYDRAVDSEFLRKVYACYFSDGVFYDQSDRLQVVADTGMQVKVSPGCVHIQGAIGIEPNQRTLVVQAADDQDRIDTVVARLDLSLDVRSIDLYIVKGTPAESPQAPAMTRDSTTWELGLANLFVAKNVSTISQQRITDTRLDTARCGQVGAPVQPPFDTEAYFTQLEAAIRAHQEDAEAQIEQLRKAIEAVEGDAAWMMKDQYDPAGLGKDVTTQVYTHSKSGTVHEFTGNGAVGRALMTADVEEGDTFAVNGKPVSAYVGAEDATDSMAGSSWNGKWVSFVFDGTAINFKGGGGLSAADKALLIPENLRKDVVLFAGTPKEVVGTLTWQDLLPEKLVVVRDGRSAEPDIFGDWIHMGLGATSYGEDYITAGQGANRAGERSSLQIDCALWSRIEFDAKLTYQGNGSVKFGIANNLTTGVGFEDVFDKYVQASGVGNRTTYAVELPASGKYYVKIAGGWATANVYNVTLTRRE